MIFLTIDNLSKFGDFFGGVFGTIISLIVAVFVILTFIETKRQTQKQQFESIYYKMLDTFYLIGKEINGCYDKEYIGDNFFRAFINLLDKNYYYKPFYQSSYGEVSGDEKLSEFVKRRVIPIMSDDKGLNMDLDEKERVNAWAFRNKEKYRGLLYEFFYTEFHGASGMYFRYLYNIIKFALEERSKYGDESKYIKLIQAQMTNEQLILLIFNINSVYGLDNNNQPTFKLWVEKYDICENIDINMHSIFNRERSKVEGY